MQKQTISSATNWKLKINKSVYISNHLAHALLLDINSIDIIRLFYLCVSLLNRDSTGFEEVTINITDYFAFVAEALKKAGNTKKKDYRGGNQRAKIRALVPALRDACVVIGNEGYALHLFDVVCLRGSSLTLRISYELAPHLLGLLTKKYPGSNTTRRGYKKRIGNFTILHLGTILALNSVRKYILYAYLRSVCKLQHKNKFQLSFEEISMLFNFSEKYKNKQMAWQIKTLLDMLIKELPKEFGNAAATLMFIEGDRAASGIEICADITHTPVMSEEEAEEQQRGGLMDEAAIEAEIAEAEERQEAEQQELMMLRIEDDPPGAKKKKWHDTTIKHFSDVIASSG